MTSTFEQTDLAATLEPIPDTHGDYCTRCKRPDLEDCVCGRLPYVSLFVYDDARQQFTWICNVCGVNVQGEPCPLHTPLDVPGLDLVDCHAVPRHERVWMAASDTHEYQPCPHCLLEQARDDHEGCEHAQHGRWRAWRVTGRVARVLARLRLLQIHSYTHSGGCHGCISIGRR